MEAKHRLAGALTFFIYDSVMTEDKKKTPLEELKHKMFVTKSSRFNADKRLRAEHKFAHISLALVSTYLIALSVAPTFDINIFYQNINYGFWSLILSVALLAISALEIGNDRTRTAFFLHQNAMKIDELLKELSTYREQDISIDLLKQFSLRYSSIISECEFNHSKVDQLECAMWNSWRKKGERIQSFFFWLILSVWHYRLYLAAIILPLVLPIFFPFINVSE